MHDGANNYSPGQVIAHTPANQPAVSKGLDARELGDQRAMTSAVDTSEASEPIFYCERWKTKSRRPSAP